MSIHRTVELLKAEDIFLPNIPIFVNRVHESFATIEHSHDFIEICYVGDGAGIHYIQDQTLSVTQGDIFFLPVGTHHVFRPISANKRHTLVVYNCIFIRSLLAKSLSTFPIDDAMVQLFSGSEWIQFRDQRGEFHRLFQKLHDEYIAQKACFEAALYTCVFEILLYMYRSGTEQLTPHQSKFTGIETILHYVHQQFAKPIALNSMAGLLGIGERQFQRVFKSYTGMTFIDYQQQLRIQEANRLIRTTDRNINDIANTVGYQDMKFFNRIYKKKTGVTPREYRSSQYN
ncbi:MAG: AraC family transcriptional regulator [Paenibacillaceae bacterium]